LANPTDPNVSFNFQNGEGIMFRIPFSAVQTVEPVDLVAGTLRSVAPNTAAAGDVQVRLRREDVDQLVDTSGNTDITVVPDTDVGLVLSMSEGVYKYLTVLGGAYQVKSVKASEDTRAVVLEVTRVDDAF
jgi:hypothetical protein